MLKLNQKQQAEHDAAVAAAKNAKVRTANQDQLDFLLDNSDKPVYEILTAFASMCAARQRQSRGRTYVLDTSGAVVAINCGYYRRWMPLVGADAVEFGDAKGATGFNSMCKDGQRAWQKANNAFNTEQRKATNAFLAGDIDEATLRARIDSASKVKLAVGSTELGFATAGELRQYFEDNGVNVTQEIQDFEAPAISLEIEGEGEEF